ncbi:MAG TPA: pyridoxamine 5'-phosphate oxidase family protein [Chloroflexota bacterium]|nr:pyridoxamine 5'-phosphate oxidase family protein [Chloroflexota bacterium]
MNTDTPLIARPDAEGYGIPDHSEGLLSWDHVLQRLAAARHYWVDTADRAGRVHATPIWGAVVDGTLYVEGGPGTKRGRNIAENPQVAVHLESGEDVVILEGIAEQIVGPDRSLAQSLVEGMEQKYGAGGYHPTADQWNEGGLYAIRPRKAFAWTRFPGDATRFLFPSGDG